MPQWSFLYQYGVGGLVFAVLVCLLARAGAINLSRSDGRRSLAMLLGIMAVYVAIHAVSVFILPRT
jgi:hypothetical protein